MSDNNGLSGKDKEKEDVPAGRWWVGDLIGGLFFMALGLFAIIASLGMPRRGSLGFFTSPGFTPLLLGVLIFLLSATLALKAVRGGALSHIGDWIKGIIKSDESRRTIVIVALLTAYVFSIGKINFVVATLVFTVVTLFYVRAGKLWQVLLYAALITTLVAVIIPFAFSMPMP